MTFFINLILAIFAFVIVLVGALASIITAVRLGAIAYEFTYKAAIRMTKSFLPRMMVGLTFSIPVVFLSLFILGTVLNIILTKIGVLEKGGFV